MPMKLEKYVKIENETSENVKTWHESSTTHSDDNLLPEQKLYGTKWDTKGTNRCISATHIYSLHQKKTKGFQTGNE